MGVLAFACTVQSTTPLRHHASVVDHAAIFYPHVEDRSCYILSNSSYLSALNSYPKIPSYHLCLEAIGTGAAQGGVPNGADIHVTRGYITERRKICTTTLRNRNPLCTHNHKQCSNVNVPARVQSTGRVEAVSHLPIFSAIHITRCAGNYCCSGTCALSGHPYHVTPEISSKNNRWKEKNGSSMPAKRDQ